MVVPRSGPRPRLTLGLGLGLIAVGLWPLVPLASVAGLAPVGVARAGDPVATGAVGVPVQLGDALTVDGVPAGSPTVVGVGVTACGRRSRGTGVVVGPDLVVTAAHVVGDAGLVAVGAPGATVTGEVLGVAADGTDLALVSVPVDAGPVPTSSPGSGEEVWILRAPAAGAAVVPGRVVAVDPGTAGRAAGASLGVDVRVPPGTSGGAVVDRRGRLAGIVVAGARPGALTLAVPVAALVWGEFELVDGSCAARPGDRHG